MDLLDIMFSKQEDNHKDGHFSYECIPDHKNYHFGVQNGFHYNKKTINEIRQDAIYKLIQDAPDTHKDAKVKIFIDYKARRYSISVDRLFFTPETAIFIFFKNDGYGRLMPENNTDLFNTQILGNKPISKLFSMLFKEDIKLTQCIAPPNAFVYEGDVLRSPFICNSDNAFYYFRYIYSRYDFDQAIYIPFYEISV